MFATPAASPATSPAAAPKAVLRLPLRLSPPPPPLRDRLLIPTALKSATPAVAWATSAVIAPLPEEALPLPMMCATTAASPATLPRIAAVVLVVVGVPDNHATTVAKLVTSAGSALPLSRERSATTAEMLLTFLAIALNLPRLKPVRNVTIADKLDISQRSAPTPEKPRPALSATKKATSPGIALPKQLNKQSRWRWNEGVVCLED